MERLRPHAGALLEVSAEPSLPWLPTLPALQLQISPAGLLEPADPNESAAATLRVRLDASDPLKVLQNLAEGRVPSAQVEGDVRLAAEVDWLMANLRWDVMDDLEAAFGAGPAQALTLLAQTVRDAFTRRRTPAADVSPDLS